MRSRREVVRVQGPCGGPFGHEFPAAVWEDVIQELPNGFWEIVTTYGPPSQVCRCGKVRYGMPTPENSQDPASV